MENPSANMEPPVDYVPRRVVSLVPALTESLFDLDLGDRLIAISDDCAQPADQVQLLARAGESQHPDMGHILDLRPDLVLLSDDLNRREDIDALRAAGAPVWVIGPRTVFDLLNVLWRIMDVFDHAIMVPRVREIERAYDYTLGAARAREPMRVCALVGPAQTFNANTYPHDALRVCGGENVFAGASDRYPVVSLDDIVGAQPDLVLLSHTAYTGADLEAFRQLDLPSRLIDGSLLTWPGTRLAFALRDLPPLLMGDGEDDPADNN
jgi:ABC-type Fe3+-hydroxamate transport system substrate-binding protein